MKIRRWSPENTQIRATINRMEPDASAQRLKESTTRLKAAVNWFADPSMNLNSWGVRLMIAAIVLLLLTSMVTLTWSYQVLQQLDRDRATRTDRTCLILTKLEATPQEKRDAGCP